MTVIIPAWSRDALRLADTPVVKLARLFIDNQVPVELLLLQPLPWLRYQLKTNQLTSLSWWNVFDDLQQVHQEGGLPLGLEDLALPLDTQFVYLSDTVLLQRAGRLYGEVHFHPAGFVSWVETTDTNGQRTVRVYDDRGFCSTQTVYNDRGRRLATLWFAPDTHPVMRRLADNHIQLLAADGSIQQRYESLDELITERTQAHLAQRSDLLISDANPGTATILTQLAQRHRLAYLLSTQLAPTLPEDLLGAVERVIVPTTQMITKFKDVNADLGTPIEAVSPYATTFALGNSTELPETTVVWAVNHLTTTAQTVVAQQIIAWLVQDEHHYLTAVVTSQAAIQKMTTRLQQQVLSQAGIPLDSPTAQLLQGLLNQLQQKQAVDREQLPDEVLTVLDQLLRIQVLYRLNDQQRQRVLGGARVLVDLGAMPDLQLQIAAISAGIPQINATTTGYVHDHQNGLIIAQLRKLGPALDYYLKTLTHWNESLVASIASLESLAEPKLLAYWKEVIAHGKQS
ncbi:accessory Sec system protein Asp1 [Levilactobacillus zymae]|uniref:accessory Sec system protein Asp1 n=1 Tax=Levilactobacillus zymae TaxID=267363 RepID=UPI0028B754F1|nr:accessory Sec system protein Asp1 [Levilactobacillus zymae]MDT6979231.1 accessory Sec system protein Asp1 [Levilactobacillus zymae]